MYKGIGASAGIGIGKVVVIKEQSLDYEEITRRYPFLGSVII